jgi:hypothetical protein
MNFLGASSQLPRVLSRKFAPPHHHMPRPRAAPTNFRVAATAF